MAAAEAAAIRKVPWVCIASVRVASPYKRGFVLGHTIDETRTLVRVTNVVSRVQLCVDRVSMSSTLAAADPCSYVTPSCMFM